MDNIFNDIFNNNPTYYGLKDRMKTLILKAKKEDKENFMKILAADYIRISKEL